MASWENVKVDGSEMKMYLSVPNSPGPHPAVVIMFHGGGVDEFVRAMADKLAGDGYAAIAPDLYHRADTTTAAFRAGHPRDRLNDLEVEADVNGTVEFLKNHPAIQGNNLGITGFCMGGRLVWLMATATKHFKAAIPHYGGNIMEAWGKNVTRSAFDRSAEISCPIMFHFGDDDVNPSPADMAKFDAELKRLGKPHEFHTYSNTGHSFMDHTNSKDHRPAAGEASWPRTLDFFARHLK